MNLEINDSNLHLLLPNKVVAVSALIAEQTSGSSLDAMQQFYHSNVYHQLEQESTKLWHLGAVALFELWLADSASKSE